MEKTGNTYEELVQLKESGEIGWREFIMKSLYSSKNQEKLAGASLSADSLR